MTLTDEGTIDGGIAKRRQRKIYSDVLGRTVKTEILNWAGGSVYSATVNTYNLRDEITEVKQYAGPEASSTFQVTTMAYDGYGRLTSRHVPEQSPGTATVWTYNADDTVNTITDARGASQTFTYNNRHLRTSITYAAPAGVALPSNVTFSYDAAGNRSTMTDGFGIKTYQYNQLSQITQESREFPVGTFAINYSYNLGGQLIGITDPFNASFSYTRNAQGQLKAVTGSPYAGFTNYITNVTYRAWGAAKSVTYAGSNSTIAFNSRMQPTQFRLTANGTGASVIREDYTYFDDGALNTLTDLDDTAGSSPPVSLRFLSRRYFYDHAGRSTGGQGTSAQAVPYNQSYSYDAFGNMIGRVGSYYNYSNSIPVSDNASYTSNRRIGWSYNADGQVTATPASSSDQPRTMAYDAVGRMVTTIETGTFSTVTYSSAYDGDGRLVYESSNASPGSSVASYIVRSSVLGGEVLTRLDQSGNKKITHVPAEGLLFATQRVSGTPGPFVLATFRNPLGITESNKVLYDPLGNFIPFQAHGDPRPPAGSFNSASMSGLSSSQANPNSYAVGCIKDGIPTTCNRVMHAIERGQAKELEILGPALTPEMIRLIMSLTAVGATEVESSEPKKSRMIELSDGSAFTVSLGTSEVWTLFLIAPGLQRAFEQNKQESAMEIARRKNCATPNSLVQQFKKEFEALWDKTVASSEPGVEGEEFGSLIFYEASTNTYPLVELSPGRHLRMGKTSYAPYVPALPEIGPDTQKALTEFRNQKRSVELIVFFHTHPDYPGIPSNSRSGKASPDDETYQRNYRNPLGIIRTGNGYSFFSNGKSFSTTDELANECIWVLNRGLK